MRSVIKAIILLQYYNIVAKALHRSLYMWDSTHNKPGLELAKDVSVSPDGLVYTYRLRDDAYFHNGRKMTAADIIWSYTRIMDRAKAYPGARYIRLVKGAAEVEKGEAKTISGLCKIDDFTLEVTLTERTDPAYYYFFAGVTAILPREEVEKGASFAVAPIGLGPFKFIEYVPGSRVVAERFAQFYKPGLPHADRVVYQIMSEASAREIAFRGKEIDAAILGSAQYTAYAADPALSKNLLEVAEA